MILFYLTAWSGSAPLEVLPLIYNRNKQVKTSKASLVLGAIAVPTDETLCSEDLRGLKAPISIFQSVFSLFGETLTKLAESRD